jgi:S-adenosylmethionine decarboxylase
MIKTCGTTQPLDGVEYIVTMARSIGMNPTDMTYSRSSFMFPADQLHPHTSISTELAYIDQMPLGKSVGQSSILGDASGKYWLVYRREFENPAYLTVDTPDNRTVSDIGRRVLSSGSETIMVDVIMTGLGREVAGRYYRIHGETDEGNKLRMAETISDNIPGFPRIAGECFNPCGYSCNGMNDDRYMTVHITPEDAFSYASVEASFSTEPAQDAFRLGSRKEGGGKDSMKEISEFVNAVVTYFNPRDILITMLSKDEGVSANNISVGKKEKFMKPPCYYTSGNLLGEDLVASSVYYSGVSSGATGTKPTGLS